MKSLINTKYKAQMKILELKSTITRIKKIKLTEWGSTREWGGHRKELVNLKIEQYTLSNLTTKRK